MRDRADIRLPTGAIVDMTAQNLIDRGDSVLAPDMSCDQILAMANEQTGPVALGDTDEFPPE